MFHGIEKIQYFQESDSMLSGTDSMLSWGIKGLIEGRSNHCFRTSLW